MRKKFSKVFAMFMAGLMIISLLPANMVFAAGEIPIDKAHFPDDIFRDFILNGNPDGTGGKIDTDGNGSLSDAELAAASWIEIPEMNISDLTGIEYFTSLTELYCYSNELTALDLSQNTALRTLSCSYNQLTDLDLSRNTDLDCLDCKENQLTNLDVSRNTALGYLDCEGNQLTSLDVSNNTVLTVLNCGSNMLTGLDISWNTDLEIFYCYNNQLSYLDISQNIALTDIDCGSNQLTSLDVSQRTGLTKLYCAANQLTSLNVSQNTKLTELGCSENRLTSLDVSRNTALWGLYCDSNQLIDLDVSQNTALNQLVCSANEFESLDVSQNTALEWLACDWNRLTSLDVSLNTALTDLYCNRNSYRIPSSPYDLSDLPEGFDISKASNWTNAAVAGNILTFNDENLPVEYTYDCGGNHEAVFSLVTSDGIPIDEEHFPDDNFRYFIITGQFVPTGSGDAIKVAFDTDGNGILSEAEIAAVGSMYASNKKISDFTGIGYFTALTELECTHNDLRSLDLSNNKALKKLICYGNQLTSLDLSQNTALTYLACASNQLTSLDFSNNTMLEKLYCGDNPLTDLNVSQNTALKLLSCFQSELTNLDLSNNKALKELYCNTNHLTSLDLSRNTALTDFYCKDNSYPLPESPYDLTGLPEGFDLSKASNWQNGTVEGSILTFNDNNTPVTYTYDCGGGHEAVFSLCISEEIPIDAEHFPDENFRTFVATGSDGITNTAIDTNGNGKLSKIEIAAVKSINVSDMYIEDLTGIGYFTALTELDCSGNNYLQSPDLRQNTKLTKLDCSNDELEYLFVDQNPALTDLICINNQLTNLNLSQNPELRTLDCTLNQLTSLDLTRNTALNKLSCGKNFLESLDLSRNTALTELYCDHNELPSLNLSQNTALTTLYCNYNSEMTYLNITKNINLTFLECSYNGFTNLNVSNNSALTNLYCHFNDITSLDLSNNTALEVLYCYQNKLREIDVSNNTELTTFWCYNNALRKLDVSNNTALKELVCDTCQLSKLDVSRNTALESLFCSDNRLTTLDLSHNTALTELHCSNNRLTSLDLSKNNVLTSLSSYGNEYPVLSSPFDLNNLPAGFHANKASNWQNGTVENNLLYFNDLNTPVTYTYNCGNAYTAKFSIYITDEIEITELYGEVNMPMDGDTVDSCSDITVPSGAGYVPYVHGWYLGDNLSNDNRLQSDDEFQPGCTYSLWVEFSPYNGYVLCDSPIAYINGREGDPESYLGEDGNYNCIIAYTVPEGITLVEADNVTVPELGGHPDFTAPDVHLDYPYTAEIYGWYIGNTFNDFVEIYEDYTFKTGETYWVWVEFMPLDGFYMSDDTVAYINGSLADPLSYYWQGDGSYNGLMSFVIPEEEITEVHANVPMPRDGANPDYTDPCVPPSAHYSADIWNWYIGDTWDNITKMNRDETFEVGKNYWVLVEFWPDEGYCMSENTVARINGHKADPNSYYGGEQQNGCYNAIFRFTVKEEITEVYAEVAVPALGAHPDFNNPAVPSGADYSASIWNWYVGDTWDEVVGINEQYIFEAGQTYWVWVQFWPADGYCMSDDTVAYINDMQVIPESYYASDGTYAGIMPFTIPEIEITEVYADNITVPADGDTPDFNDPTVPAGAHYSADIFEWDEGDVWNSASPMNENDVFEAGKTYWVWVEFWPDDGYTFGDNTAAYINGSQADPNSYYGGEGENGCYDAVFKFTIPKIEITEVYADNITVPAAGAHPDLTALTVPDGAHYSANICEWDVGDTLDGSVLMNEDDTFEAGKTYWVYVEFLPDDGYTFGDYTVAYINGSQADPESYYWAGDGSYNAFMPFTVTEEITEVYADVTVPVACAYPDYSNPAVPAGAVYSTSIYHWYIGDTCDDEFIMPNGTAFERGQTYCLWVEFWPDDGYYMSDNTVAYINGIQAGPSSHYWEYDGSYNAIILFTVPKEKINDVFATDITVPAPGDHPDFTDPSVSPSAPYSAAIMNWYVGDTWGNSVIFGSSDTFERGRTYWVWVKFLPADGYCMSDDTAAYINGDQAAPESYYLESDGSYNGIISFTVPKEEITVVHADSITEPVIGAHPDSANITVPDGANYSANIYGWYIGDTWENNAGINGDETFEGGQTYWLLVEFRPADGYYLTDNTNAYINSLPAGPESYYEQYNGVYNAIISFTVPEEKITAVFADVTKPLAGAHPDFADITVPGAAHYSADICGWYVGDTWESVEMLDSSDTFEPGRTYWVWVKFLPDNGYYMNEYTTAYINDSQTLPESYYSHGDGSYNGIMWFHVPEEEITEVYADVTMPAVGAHPDFTAPAVPGGAHYSADIFYWLVGDTSSEGTAINEDDIFEPGQTYWVWVEFRPDDGYYMSDSTVAYINGSQVNSESYYLESTGSYIGIISFTIPEAEITEVHADNITVPMAGAHPDFTAPSVPAGAHYSADIYGWFVGDTFSDCTEINGNYIFKPGKTYWVWVEFRPDDGYYMSDDTIAYINGSQVNSESYYLGSTGSYIGIISFTIPESEIIEVCADNITVPAAGDHPDFTSPSVPAGAHYSASVLNWYVGDTWENSETLDGYDTFEGGRTYWVLVRFQPDDGYYMSDSTVAYINGSQAGPESYYQESDGTYNAVISFTLPEENEGLLGDYDCNGIVDMTDVVLTMQAALNIITPSEQSLANADIDGDGVLTMTDAVYIMGIALHLN